MPAIDKCSRHNMPRSMEDDGCAKSSGSNAVTCPHQPAKTLPMGHLNSSMPHTIGGGTIRGCRNNIRAARRHGMTFGSIHGSGTILGSITLTIMAVGQGSLP
jgi:hypothetical protein